MNNDLSQLKPFCGTVNEDFIKWIHNFEHYTTTIKLSPGKKLRFLKNSIKDAAALELKNLPIEIKSNYDTLVEILRYVFASKNYCSTTEGLAHMTIINFPNGNKILAKIKKDVDKISKIQYPRIIKDEWNDNNYQPSKIEIICLEVVARNSVRNGYLFQKYGDAILEHTISFRNKDPTNVHCMYGQSYIAFRNIKYTYLRAEDKRFMLDAFKKLCSSLTVLIDKKALSEAEFSDMISFVVQEADSKLIKNSMWTSTSRAVVLLSKNFTASQLLSQNKFSELATLYRSVLNVPASGYKDADCIISAARYNLAILTKKIKKQHTAELCKEIEFKIKENCIRPSKTIWNTIRKDTNIPDLKQCANCNVEMMKMKICKSCKQVGFLARYCSKKCQTDHWPVHIKFCGKINSC